jgi:TrwC relaxase/AAA domain
MLTFRVGAAGSPGAAKKMAEHLVTQTLPETASELAAYYQRGIGAEEDPSETAANPQASDAVQPGTRPEPRRDMHPQLAALLGIDLSRPTTREEIAHLLAGMRTDGELIAGKQYQKATLPLAEIFGLDPLRTPTRDEFERVFAGQRADGSTVDPEQAAAALVRLRKLLGAADGKSTFTEAELANIGAGKTAKGDDLSALEWRRILTASKSPVGYVDFTFSADKTVSLAWAFAPTEAERNAIAQAHREAVHKTMLLVAETIGRARIGQGGRNGAEPGAIGWISFDHYAARPTLEIARAKPDGTIETELVTVKVAGDPQLHTHVAVPNVVLTPTGRVGSLDTMRMHHKIHEWGAIYQAHLAQNLRALGADVALDEGLGAARLTAIPESVRSAFSKRTRDAVDDAKRFAASAGMDWDRMSAEERIKLFKSGAYASRIDKGDDLSDFASWRRQLEALGYRHKSVLDPDRPEKTVPETARQARAYEVGARLLAQSFERRAVISEADARVAAARSLIAAGIESAGEVDQVRGEFSRKGVPLSGTGDASAANVRGFTTRLIEVPVAHSDPAAENGPTVETRITTRAHLAQETALIELARKHGTDRRGLLDRQAIEHGLAASGLEFAGEHGQAQRRLIDHLGTSGRFAVAIGAAGAGKTMLLRPLVSAWHAEGADIHGLSLGWRQARDLAEAGLTVDRGDSVAATSVFIDRVKSGRVTPSDKSVVVIDELATIGSRQLLDLLRLQDRYGFRMVAIGDPKQCQAIEAGFVTRLLEQALGSIPSVESSIRQTDPRAREITKLLRRGEAATALDMKREDGTAEIVPCGYREIVARAADLWHEHRAANVGRAGYTLSVSAPTNDDARAIGAAIRTRLQAEGILGRNRKILDATDPNSGADYALPIAAGDRVRLFARTNANLGEGRSGAIGDNGSILEVRSVRRDGLVLRNAKGTEGHVTWASLADPQSGRLRLTYGYAMTTNTAQGITSTEHIFVTPGGSQATDGHRTYVSGSRHRERDYWLTSEGAEKQEVINRRPLGDPRPVGPADLWMNWARNISRAPEKLNATDLVHEADDVRRAAARDFLKGMARHEARSERAGQGGELARHFERERVRAQAAESGFARSFADGYWQAEGTFARLGRVATAVRTTIAAQLRNARPVISCASTATQARIVGLMQKAAHERARLRSEQGSATEPEEAARTRSHCRRTHRL